MLMLTRRYNLLKDKYTNERKIREQMRDQGDQGKDYILFLQIKDAKCFL